MDRHIGCGIHTMQSNTLMAYDRAVPALSSYISSLSNPLFYPLLCDASLEFINSHLCFTSQPSINALPTGYIGGRPWGWYLFFPFCFLLAPCMLHSFPAFKESASLETLAQTEHFSILRSLSFNSMEALPQASKLYQSSLLSLVATSMTHYCSIFIFLIPVNNFIPR